jgi:uncharacterized protein YaeQ
MALPSTLHHLDLHISNVDRGVDRSLTVKVARHPSETMDRLWLRVLALAWQWEEGLAFGPGLCDPDAPDLLAEGPDGRITLLVRVGKPDLDRIVRDVSQRGGARIAALYESPRRLDAVLAEGQERGLERLTRADLAAVDPGLLAWLSTKDDRRLRVSITLVADHLYIDLAGDTRDGPLHRKGYLAP